MAPLRGIRVLEVGRLLPSSLCGQLLADLGAEVIKIEEPGVGDYMRRLPLFASLSRGKKSVTLNLRRAEGRKLLYALVARSHVLVESFRPQAARELGLGPGRLRRVNRRLVHCSITGYGKRGPYSMLASHDINCAGLAALLPKEGYEPLLPLLVADIAAGLAAALYICAALASRKGAFIDLAMADAALPFSLYRLTLGLAGKKDALMDGRNPFYSLYKTKEGKPVSLAALEPEFQEALSRLLSERALDRKKLERAFSSLSLEELMALARKWDLPLQRVNELGGLAYDEHYRAREALAVKGGVVRLSLARFNGRALYNDGPPCALGEHTEEVLSSLGLKRGDIEALRRRGVV
jgi:alpha-methylacyl-CoA racemase